MKNCICILLALLVMATGDSVVMAAADNPGDKAQNDLITAYVAAVNAKDMEKLKAVIHPKCLAEITDDNREMVSKILAGEFKDTIPADYKKESKMTPPLPFPCLPAHIKTIPSRQ